MTGKQGVAFPDSGIDRAVYATGTCRRCDQPPFGITHTPSIELVGAPCSVMPNTLEDDRLIRLFPERLAYGLPSTVTVTAPDGSTKMIAEGMLVDSYYLHADWVNQGQNVAKVFDGNLTFAQPVFGVIKTSNALINTHTTLGATWYPTIKTTYSTSGD